MKLYYAAGTCSLSPHIVAAEAGIALDLERLSFVDAHLAASGPLLMGEHFTAADAYLFTVASWSRVTKVDVTGLPHLQSFMERVGARPAVREAMQAERMRVAA